MEYRTPDKLLRLLEKTVASIAKNRFQQNDMNLNRETMSLPGHFIVIKDKEILDFLKNQPCLEKYDDDICRMNDSYESMINKARHDLNSRQLMVFNDSDFHKINQCFTSFQFVYTKRNEFDLYVYQRSSDVSKLIDDLIFFGNVSQIFENDIDKKVSKIVIIYGNIHYEIKE
jgi:hypothetical protein